MFSQTPEDIPEPDFDRIMAQVSEAIALSEEIDVQPPMFDDEDLPPFTFGVTGEGDVVVRQIDETGEESWQYVGNDGTRL
jgi:hypothetical protein